MRTRAFNIVYGTMENGGYSNELFEAAVSGSREPGASERKFLRRLSYGTIERALELDTWLGLFARMPIEKMKPAMRTILRMGAYELLYMDSVPAAATCNEMVELAKRKGMAGMSGVVNGILRNLARTDRQKAGERLIAGYGRDVYKRDSFLYSTPIELVRMLVDTYGRKTAEKILTSFSEDTPVTIRVQQMNASVEQVREELERAGVQTEPGSYAEGALRLKGAVRVEELPGFAEGHFTVQDESAMIPVLASGCAPGSCVMDVCASPGGKSLQFVDVLRGSGFVSARDVSEEKMVRLRENIARLRADKIEAKVWDGTEPDAEWRGRADVVLADVPCSGIGVIGKKPEIKYRAMEHAKTLVEVQRKIVAATVEALKPGGIFIYSTCTIHPAENEENVRWIEENLALRLDSLNPYIPKILHNKMTARGMLPILPGIHKGDGFFVARFVKEP